MSEPFHFAALAGLVMLCWDCTGWRAAFAEWRAQRAAARAALIAAKAASKPAGATSVETDPRLISIDKLTACVKAGILAENYGTCASAVNGIMKLCPPKPEATGGAT